MSRANDTAYPSDKPADPSGGLTIREHFAAMAMQGILAGDYMTDHCVPAQAVKLADALIAELAEEPT